jgi:hypothetical protein
MYKNYISFANLLLLVVIGAVIYYVTTLRPESQAIRPATNPFPNARIHITNPAVSPMGGLMKY